MFDILLTSQLGKKWMTLATLVVDNVCLYSRRLCETSVGMGLDIIPANQTLRAMADLVGLKSCMTWDA